jgi:hypothetical protein
MISNILSLNTFILNSTVDDPVNAPMPTFVVEDGIARLQLEE